MWQLEKKKQAFCVIPSKLPSNIVFYIAVLFVCIIAGERNNAAEKGSGFATTKIP